MTSMDDVVKNYIREYMTERFYIEGKEEDYYFGKSELNEELTVFYNDIGNATSNLAYTIKSAVNDIYYRLSSDYNLSRYSSKDTDLSNSAFCIPAHSLTFIFRDDDDNSFEYNINYMKTGVLEEAIRNNPKRWELYKKGSK